MIKFLKQQWWKYTAAIILLYVLIGGMLVPLGPGLRSITPVNFPTDSTIDFVVTGYNTHFQEAGDLQIWFKPATGVDFYAADSIIPIINSTARVVFHVPAADLGSEPNRNFDLVLNDKLDGTLVMTFATVAKASGHTDSTLARLKPVTPEIVNAHSKAFAFPFREILFQSIRNTFFHVPMWFTMMFLVILSTVYSIRYLRTGSMTDDVIASQAVAAALLFGVLGLTTGMMWATYTWGSPWPNDPKLHGAAVGVIIYLAYIVLRGSLTDEIQRARISAVYNIFAVVIFTLFIFIIPRLTASLHPGNGGNPAFSKYDLDSHLRLFFYPAVIGWILLSCWILSILVRLRLLQLKKSSQ